MQRGNRQNRFRVLRHSSYDSISFRVGKYSANSERNRLFAGCAHERARTNAHAYIYGTRTHADAMRRVHQHGQAPVGRAGVDYCASDSVTSHWREFTAVFFLASLPRYVRDLRRNNVFLLSESVGSAVTRDKGRVYAIGPMRRLTLRQC